MLNRSAGALVVLGGLLLLLEWPGTGGAEPGVFLPILVKAPGEELNSLVATVPPVILPEADADTIAASPADGTANPEGSERAVADPALSDRLDSFLDPLSPPLFVLPPYPVIWNDRVQQFVDLFQSGSKRSAIGKWLDRSSRYLGMIREVFRRKGLPEELAYTAMIESGFNPVAVSRAGAKGLWQFMEQTARRYGLIVNQWVDERLDPYKSTAAAAEYLKDLYGLFGSWFLAQAAYNAGEIKVARAMQRSGSQDFWDLTRGRVLRDETKRFVPAIQAATLIAREPGRYGFEVTPEPPEEFDLVTVPFQLEIKVIARLGEVPTEALRQLNPELRRAVTPPDGQYLIKVPPGSGPRIEAELEKLAGSESFRWTTHRVRKGQTLPEVAGRYRTTVERLKEINNLTASALRPGTELVIPLSLPAKSVAVKSDAGVGAGEMIHVVKPGETLGGIARRYRVSVEEIAGWNGLSDPGRIFPGYRLRVADPAVRLEARASR